MPEVWLELDTALRERLRRVLDDQERRVTEAELRKLAEDGITAEELERGKGQLRGGLVLSLEDSGSRMSRLGKAELVYDDLLGIDEVIARIDAVTAADVQALGRELFTPERYSLAVVGPYQDEEHFKQLLGRVAA